MKIALLLDNYTSFENLKKFDYIIGVDKGAYNAYIQNINIDFAIGDFDSISEEEYLKLTTYTKTKKLNPIKDLTDTAEALKMAFDISNDVTILGGIQGNRIEHFIANLNLFDKYPLLKIQDDNSLIFLQEESFELDMIDYYYVSFYAKEEIKDLTLKGFKYNLDNYNLKPFDSLAVSNEAIKNPTVLFSTGKILVILSKKDN